jgi:hypothetical protein
MRMAIGQAPESDFCNPLGMLSDCHRRIALPGDDDFRYRRGARPRFG